jgi:hypothetical protein
LHFYVMFSFRIGDMYGAGIKLVSPNNMFTSILKD